MIHLLVAGSDELPGIFPPKRLSGLIALFEKHRVTLIYIDVVSMFWIRTF